MPSTKINGIDLYYEVAGEGPSIAFAHGAAWAVTFLGGAFNYTVLEWAFIPTSQNFLSREGGLASYE